MIDLSEETGLDPFYGEADLVGLYPPGVASAWRTIYCDTGSELKKDD
jgi:hypothetical protein